MVWSHIILEGYCMFTHLSKKRNIFYELENLDNFKIKNKIVKENKNYKSSNKRPNWCIKQNKKRVPQFRCFSYGKDEKKCHFFGYANAEKSDYNQLNKIYKKLK
ncbi:hypothetical protein GOV08_00850 [Candidatus Woesearchaeota archaeon]|nr:hypothetical protein [Candidatus Woesearchaeota archaeon]